MHTFGALMGALLTLCTVCAHRSGVLPFRLLEALEGIPAAPVQRNRCKTMGATVNTPA